MISIKINDLVGSIPTPLKKMSLSVAMMTFPTIWEKEFMFQTAKQGGFDGTIFGN